MPMPRYRQIRNQKVIKKSRYCITDTCLNNGVQAIIKVRARVGLETQSDQIPNTTKHTHASEIELTKL